MWRHNEILGIIADITKMCYRTANKISCIKTSIQFVKEGNISKTPHRNRHKPTLLDGCTDWRVVADVDCQLAFPTEITSTRFSNRNNISVQILSFGQLIQRKLSLLDLRPLSRLTSNRRISGNWKSTKTHVNSVLRMAGQLTYFVLRLDVEVLF